MTAAIKKDAWEVVTSMETPFWTIHDILTAIGIMAPEIDGDESVAALQRLVSLAQTAWKTAERGRGELFHMLHPGAATVLPAGALSTEDNQ